MFGLFRKRTAYNVALIDVSSASVRGAFARIEEKKPPVIYYTLNLSIDPSVDGTRPGDLPKEQMLASVEVLAKQMIAEGAPVLRQATGSGHVQHLFVSVGAPWQRSDVRVETIQKEKPFIFTQSILDEMTRKNEVPEGLRESGETVVATILNGYESRQPVGKRVKRADLVILSSMIDRAVAEAIERTLRRAYHHHQIDLVAFAPVAYEMLRDLYPHQRDFLVFDVAGTATDVVFVKGGLLIDVKTLDTGVHDLLHAARTSGVTGIDADSGTIIDPARNAQFANRVSEVQAAWLESLRSTLADFSTRHPLPRTIFLLADAETRDFLKRLLDTDPLRSLWLSEEPFQIVPILPQQFSEVAVFRGAAEGDAYLAMLALYYTRRVLHFAPGLVLKEGPSASTESAA